ncbi:unnamed protein product [Owenia fusiformis]|uniref:Uncharacterized protein n=1 Tax=Owenia fusiformis TaxID=6347 RepID=A0A8J1XZL6_OWEFU|nr:unnamed protein product [Owenia fusiformis]
MRTFKVTRMRTCWLGNIWILHVTKFVFILANFTQSFPFNRSQMMNSKQDPGGIFGGYGMGDPNVGLAGSPNSGALLSPLHPYLNVDPSLVGPGGAEYIFPEGASKTRGRFEMAFSQIGGSVFAGGAVGGANGIITGIKETAAAQLTGPVRRTQMLNYIAKQGASSAQALGVVALMYSVFGVIISKARGADDELNTLTAATMTGLLYKSSAGWKKCGRAGAVGFGLAAVYCLYTSKDRIKGVLSSKGYDSL